MNIERTPCIPPVTDRWLASLFEDVKPVQRFVQRSERIEPSTNGTLCYVGPAESIIEMRRLPILSMEPYEHAEGLETVGQIITHHKREHPSRFVPTIAEVLAQIPAGYLEQLKAFEVRGPMSAFREPEFEHADPAPCNRPHHVAMTVLYR